MRYTERLSGIERRICFDVSKGESIKQKFYVVPYVSFDFYFNFKFICRFKY